MKKILVVASDKAEIKGFEKHFLTLVSGVGPILASAKTAGEIVKSGAEVVISVGTCGSLGRIKRGEVVSFSTVVTPDQDLSSMHLSLGATIDWNRSTIKELRTGDRKSGLTLLSSGTFTSSYRDAFSHFSPDCVDMEAYGVGIAALSLGIPFYAVKLVSDIVGDHSTVGDISFSMREGRERLLEVLLELKDSL
ncbi:MAG: hypothetical protein MSS69_04055 [Spirochaetales bacterium]|nr:hypothetical protein [Spirochaetales bacterium]